MGTFITVAFLITNVTMLCLHNSNIKEVDKRKSEQFPGPTPRDNQSGCILFWDSLPCLWNYSFHKAQQRNVRETTIFLFPSVPLKFIQGENFLCHWLRGGQAPQFSYLVFRCQPVKQLQSTRSNQKLGIQPKIVFTHSAFVQRKDFSFPTCSLGKVKGLGREARKTDLLPWLLTGTLWANV